VTVNEPKVIVGVSVNVLVPLLIVSVSPAGMLVPAKVAVTVAALMLVVSTNALEPTTAELVRVRVGTAFELGTAPTVAMDDSVVALVPRVNTLEGDVLVMVMFCPLAGALAVNVPVAVAAAGALP
jgi:hypothetical protein